MAPNADLAFLKSMSKKKSDLGGSTSGTQGGSGTPAPDLTNIQRATPLTTVRVTQDPGCQAESRPAKKKSSQGREESSRPGAVDEDVQKRKRDDQLEIPKDSKRAKGLRSSKHRAEPVPVTAEFFAKNLEEYKVDPFTASAKLFSHIAAVKKHEMAEFQARTKAELEQANAKLLHTAQILQEQSTKLKEANQKITSLTSERDGFKGDAEALGKRVKDLESKIAELEKSEKELKEKVTRLEEKIRELERKLETEMSGTTVDPVARVAELEAQLVETKGERDRAAELALKMAKFGFDNAIAQLALVYPSFQFDPAIVNADHEVDEGRIIREDPDTEEKTVIYPPE